MVLAKSSLLRLLLEKPPAKPVPAQLPVKTLVMIVLSQAQVRFAQAGFSSVRGGTRCWRRCGAHKGPTART